MNSRNSYALNVLLSCLILCAVTLGVAQAGTDASYQSKRNKAAELFSSGKRLEALPLLEDLVKTNPRDDEMLVALAACLVNYASTLSDPSAAGQERLRARDLLEKARRLGNTSTLGENLAELLNSMPDSGAIKFSGNPAVEKAMEAGEAAFAQRNFDEAIKDYKQALALEPKIYPAVLFTANAYDKKDQFAQAAEWYQRAIELDPNTETAYRYFADMAARKGDMKRARALLIEAAVAEPYNRLVWRELHAWASLNNTKINEIYIGVPAPQSESIATGSTVSQEIAAAWNSYRKIREDWTISEFKKHFPAETEYRHSMAEEYAGLIAVASRLKKIEAERKLVSLNDPSADLLLKLDQAGFLEPYILFSLGDSGISKDYTSYRAKNRAKLKEYLEEFVVPRGSN